jgi:hypothetical protein
MAQKPKPKPKTKPKIDPKPSNTVVKKAPAKAPKKGNGDTPPANAVIGHNYRIDPKKAKASFDRLDRIHKEKAESNAGYMADINNAYEQGASTLGIPEKILKKEYRKHKLLQSIQDDYANLEPDEKDIMDGLDLALGSYKDTPLGRFAMETAELRAAVGNPAPSLDKDESEGDEGDEGGNEEGDGDDDNSHPVPDFE